MSVSEQFVSRPLLLLKGNIISRTGNCQGPGCLIPNGKLPPGRPGMDRSHFSGSSRRDLWAVLPIEAAGLPSILTTVGEIKPFRAFLFSLATQWDKETTGADGWPWVHQGGPVAMLSSCWSQSSAGWFWSALCPNHLFPTEDTMGAQHSSYPGLSCSPLP